MHGIMHLEKGVSAGHAPAIWHRQGSYLLSQAGHERRYESSKQQYKAQAGCKQRRALFHITLEQLEDLVILQASTKAVWV